MVKTTQDIPKQNLILFDWLTFTRHCDSTESIIELLGMQHISWQKMEKGRNGYRQRYFFENISILFDGADNMGVCVDMSGTGCRAFETYSQTGWTPLLNHLHLCGGMNAESGDYKITRLDMAFDDHTGILDIDELRDDTDEHLYVSRSRTWKVEYGSTGTTIYHGSPTSNMYIRIYDKAAEQAAKADDPRAFEDVHWIRVEMQMRDEIAKGFVDGLMSNTVGNQFRGVLHNYLRYVVPTKDQNMSRWDLAPYWAELLEGVGKIRCWSAPGEAYTIWNLSNYVINQAGNALDVYIRIFGQEDLIRELGKRAVNMSPKYLRLLAKYERLKKEVQNE